MTVAYIATEKVLGLSKFARIAHQFAHRLQLQERLTHQIADEIQRVTGSDDVFVVGRGEHLCMSMRGIKTEALMSNSVVRGRFRELPALRAEAISLMAQETVERQALKRRTIAKEPRSQGAMAWLSILFRQSPHYALGSDSSASFS